MVERREMRVLSAVIAIDVVGYSRHMGRNEETTLRRLRHYRDLIDQIIRRHGGRVFGVVGDSEMAVLPDAVEALRGALEIQNAVEACNAGLAEKRRMPLRLGINFGQVRIEGDGIYGDDINIAARLENFAEPGEICISDAIFDRVHGKVPCDFADFGPQRFKNIRRTVRVYGIRASRWSSGKVNPAHRRRRRPGQVARTVAAIAVIITIGAVILGYYAYHERAQIVVETDQDLAAARLAVEAAEHEVVRLMGELRAAETRAIQEQERVKVLLSSLHMAERKSVDGELAAEAAAAWERKAKTLMVVLGRAQIRLRDERARAEELLAALAQAEQRAGVARRSLGIQATQQVGRKRREEAQGRDELFLTTWSALKRQAWIESGQSAILLSELMKIEKDLIRPLGPVSALLAPPLPRRRPRESELDSGTRLPAIPKLKPIRLPATTLTERTKLNAVFPDGDVSLQSSPPERIDFVPIIDGEPNLSKNSTGLSFQTPQQATAYLLKRKDALVRKLWTFKKAYSSNLHGNKTIPTPDSRGEQIQAIEVISLADGVIEAMFTYSFGSHVERGIYLLTENDGALEFIGFRPADKDRTWIALSHLNSYLAENMDELSDKLQAYGKETGDFLSYCERTQMTDLGTLKIFNAKVVDFDGDRAFVDIHYGSTVPSCNTVESRRFEIGLGSDGLQIIGRDSRIRYDGSINSTAHALAMAKQIEIDAYLSENGQEFSEILETSIKKNGQAGLYCARTNLEGIGRLVIYGATVVDVKGDEVLLDIHYGNTAPSCNTIVTDRVRASTRDGVWRINESSERQTDGSTRSSSDESTSDYRIQSESWKLWIHSPKYFPTGYSKSVYLSDGHFAAPVAADGWLGEISGDFVPPAQFHIDLLLRSQSTDFFPVHGTRPNAMPTVRIENVLMRPDTAGFLGVATATMPDGDIARIEISLMPSSKIAGESDYQNEEAN